MSTTPYRVLARKYRPSTFSELVGQEVLVRTLSNAFASGRIAHAFLLTGIRGIGKTTTARIIARGLNCLGADGNGEPTTTPCGVCANCKGILEERHVDVIEMDAASRTGVDDIRDIIDNVHYAPASARYKVYIIDEVHMLSKNAFNALLKTLEEPPPHVKFIFATTEMRKIPVTIVSRCQRFDLKRLTREAMIEHLGNVAAKESVTLDSESLTLIATASEGSVRDALSLLDQAIALGTQADGTVKVDIEEVRDMLGLADRSRAFDLLERLLAGETAAALTQLRELYRQGIDPLLLVQDLLDLVHYLTRVRIDVRLAAASGFTDVEQQRARNLTDSLDMPALTRTWQMLLKGLQEVKYAPNALAAAEMLVVRMAYASTLPSPLDAVRLLEQHGMTGTAGAASIATALPPTAPRASPIASHSNLALAVSAAPEPVVMLQADAVPTMQLASFAEAVQLFQTKREALLYSHLYNDARLVEFREGVIRIQPAQHLSPDIPARIGRHLSEWTGQKWLVSLVNEEGAPSLHEQAQAHRSQAISAAANHPDVKMVMETFPGATIVDIDLN